MTKAIVPLTLGRQDFCAADTSAAVAANDLTARQKKQSPVFKDFHSFLITADDQRRARRFNYARSMRAPTNSEELNRRPIPFVQVSSDG